MPNGMCVSFMFIWIYLVFASGIYAADQGPERPLLHPLFSDAAVLQRGKPISLWGWTAAGAEVSVVLSGSDLGLVQVRVTADAVGRWMAQFPAQNAGGPCAITAISGTMKSEAKNVMIGDVWLCGGQSNMEWPVRNAAGFENERAMADYPQIRHICVEKKCAGRPQELMRGQWKLATPGNVGEFSAVGYYFGRQLHRDLRVPIGIVTSTPGIVRI